MNILLDLLTNALLGSWPGGRDRRSLLKPARDIETRAQEHRIYAWAQAHQMRYVDRDAWVGRDGRFTLEIHTFLRPEGALSMRFVVGGAPAEPQLPQVRATATKNWSPLFETVSELECIRASTLGLEFSLHWKSAPECFERILEHLEALHQAAQASYR
jgi:hypothetical protein